MGELRNRPSPGWGERTFFRPLRGLPRLPRSPTACAVGLRRGLLYFALTGWGNALSTGYAWILAIRFGIGESATLMSHTRVGATA